MKITRRDALRGVVATAAAATVAGGAIGWDLYQNRPERPLQEGDQGPHIAELQIQVAGWARDPDGDTQHPWLSVDGEFGPQTTAAVRRFQVGWRVGETNGQVGPATREALRRLRRPDESTLHFAWIEFFRLSIPRTNDDAIRENTRRMMYKLEALRRKLGDTPIIVKAGYNPQAANKMEQDRRGDNMLHAWGAAADLSIAGAPRRAWYQQALTCGFTGVGAVGAAWQHCDSRLEVNKGFTEVWWADGAGT